MTSLLALLALAGLTQLAVALVVNREDRPLVSMTVLVTWVSCFLVLTWVNVDFPFAGGGDDEDYFSMASTSFGTDAFDFTRFGEMAEQPGYPWLLSMFCQIAGQDLLTLKLLNVTFFVLLVPTWYRIGFELDGSPLGRVMAIAIPLLSPLWYYWIFLLKDIIIVFLQGVFLLGVVRVSRATRGGGWGLVVVSTLALIPFRTQLVLTNVAALMGVVALMSFRERQRRRVLFGTLLVSFLVIAGVIGVASSPEWMAELGISSEQRIIGSEAFVDSARGFAEQTTANRVMFPVRYLLTETSGLTPEAWINFDTESIRGMLAIPWILIVVPLSLAGIRWLLRPVHAVVVDRFITRIQSARMVATPWGVLLLFIGLYATISLTVGDTTRWRISDMPAITLVAMAGWLSMTSSNRVRLLLSWSGCLVGGFALFHLVRGMSS